MKSRAGVRAIRRKFTDAVRAVMNRIASLIPGRRKSEDEALAIVATMVGALTLARAVDDPELSIVYWPLRGHD